MQALLSNPKVILTASTLIGAAAIYWKARIRVPIDENEKMLPLLKVTSPNLQSNTQPYTAIVLGSTGASGSQVVKALQSSKNCVRIIAPQRRKDPQFPDQPKIQEILNVDFSNPGTFDSIWNTELPIKLFLCIGTTTAKTPDQNQYKYIDYEIPISFYQSGARHIDQVLLISSMGANEYSKTWYTYLKGRTEQALARAAEQYLTKVSIFRPSMILTERNESRTLERIAQTLVKAASNYIPLKYKGITTLQIANSMVRIAESNQGHKVAVYENDIMLQL